MERAWEHYLQAERKELRLRREGLLARLLGAPLPDESMAELALVTAEDRLKAEAGLVELRDLYGGVSSTSAWRISRARTAWRGRRPRGPGRPGSKSVTRGALAGSIS